MKTKKQLKIKYKELLREKRVIVEKHQSDKYMLPHYTLFDMMIESINAQLTIMDWIDNEL